MGSQAGTDLCVRRLAGRDPCVHHEIHGRQFLLAVSKRFAREALHAIAVDRVACGFDPDGETEAGMSESTGSHDDEKQCVGRPLTFTVNGVEFRFVGEASLARKAARGERNGGALPGSGQTARRLRPFARRRLSTRRPPLVAMRARKPWTRLRCRLLGLKVRFIVGSV
jgi:hypothetical protein